jgi:hypothetical protein
MRFCIGVVVAFGFLPSALLAQSEKPKTEKPPVVMGMGGYLGMYPLQGLAMYPLQGKVLDVLDANQVLLSFGANQGARKGLEANIYRLKRERRGDRIVGKVELVQVGAKFSIGRFLDPPKQVRENDMVTVLWPAWTPFWMRPELPRMQRMYELPGWNWGGAIIDLSGPMKGK